jgi:helix-turn-helix protein
MEIKIMTDEQEVLNKTSIKYISSLPDPIDKVKKGWQNGFISITDKRVILGSENEETSIYLSEITDLDIKIDIGKLAIGSTRVVPIQHTTGDKKLVSLISTTNENIKLFITILLVCLATGSDIEFVCPFSIAGKVNLDKQPVRGIIKIEENMLCLTSEWLGKKQNEIIDITKIDNFEKGKEQFDRASITLKYIKDGVIISTLITANKRIVNFLNKYIKILKDSSEKDNEDIELNEQQFMLLQMMYTSDINAEMATQMLGISTEELGKIVQELIVIKVLRVSGEKEVELTEKGIRYIVEQMKKNLC